MTAYEPPRIEEFSIDVAPRTARLARPVTERSRVLALDERDGCEVWPGDVLRLLDSGEAVLVTSVLLSPTRARMRRAWGATPPSKAKAGTWVVLVGNTGEPVPRRSRRKLPPLEPQERVIDMAAL